MTEQESKELCQFFSGWSEKMSIAGFVAGVFQEKPLLGIGSGLVFLVIAVYLKWRSMK